METPGEDEVEVYWTANEVGSAILLLEDAGTEANTTEYEEEDLVWALVTWKKARDGIAKAKIQRRFPGGPNLKVALKKVKCWNCAQKGHISKDCKQPRKPGKGKGKGKGKSVWFAQTGAASSRSSTCL